MAKAMTDLEKKKRGRPMTDATPVLVRMPRKTIAALDVWIGRQTEPKPSRPDAVRRLLDHILADGGPKTVLSVEQKIARAKRKVANIDVPDEPSLQKGVAMLRRGTAEAGLAALKAKKKQTTK
jgi:hypothetical protein